MSHHNVRATAAVAVLSLSVLGPPVQAQDNPSAQELADLRDHAAAHGARSHAGGNSMFFDPMYFIFILPGLGLSLWASARVKRAFNTYSGSVATFGITRESPLGGPRYTANPNTLWISRV